MKSNGKRRDRKPAPLTVPPADYEAERATVRDLRIRLAGSEAELGEKRRALYGAELTRDTLTMDYIHMRGTIAAQAEALKEIPPWVRVTVRMARAFVQWLGRLQP